MTIYTVGHSNRSIDDFIDLLRENGVLALADVRTIPKSRHNPQFGQEALSEKLTEIGIVYRHFAHLGGLRRARPDSVNGGWRNASFRGYADYMQSVEFADAVVELVEFAGHAPTAVMCAEAVPWRCHRSLIGDALLVHGIDVIDIMGPKSFRPHKLTPFAKVEGKNVTYPDQEV